MASVKRLGLMELNMRANILTAVNRVRVNFRGKTGPLMRENLKTIILKVSFSLFFR